jgi:N-acetylmuramoyl-L-alanine amidase
MNKKMVAALILVFVIIIACSVVCIKFTSIYVVNQVMPLKGIKIVIDPGHGGLDPGKTGINGENESVLNLKIALKLKQTLQVMGAEVVMTRETDEGLMEDGEPWRKDDDMRIRHGIIQNSGADIMISIHLDSHMPDRSVSGTGVLYYEKSQYSKELALAVTKRLKLLDTDGVMREIKQRDNLLILKDNPMPSIIVECGFISNAAEEKLLQKDYHQSKIAVAIARGIVDFIYENAYFKNKLSVL